MIFTAVKCLVAPLSVRRAADPSTFEDASSSLQTKNGVASNATSGANIDLEAQENSIQLQEAPVRNTKPKSFWARHKPSARVIGDFTIGLSDGMTVPFALTAGLSFLGSTKLVVLAGLAELVAGTISMAIGGYLGARGEAKSYKARLIETEQAITNSKALKLVQDSFAHYPGVPTSTITAVFHGLENSPNELCSFLMRNYHGMTEPKNSRPGICALTIGSGYLFGGLLPLVPYFIVKQDKVRSAFYASLAIMIVALFTFGYLKTGLDEGWRGKHNVKSAFMEGCVMLLIGGAAVGLSILVILGINHAL